MELLENEKKSNQDRTGFALASGAWSPSRPGSLHAALGPECVRVSEWAAASVGRLPGVRPSKPASYRNTPNAQTSLPEPGFPRGQQLPALSLGMEMPPPSS